MQTAITVGIPKKSDLRRWRLPFGPTLDLNFKDNKAFMAGAEGIPANFITFARSSQALHLANNSTTNWNTFGSNIPRIVSNLGILVEEARTNAITNMAGSDAVNGVIGSGGALPSGGWSSSGFAGLTLNITGHGAANGFDYIDFSITGTSSGTSGIIWFDTVNKTATSNGQSWTLSAFFQRLSGNFTNFTNMTLFGTLYDAALAGLTDQMFTTNIHQRMTTTLVRESGSATLATANTAWIQPKLEFGWNVSQAINLQFKMGWPQLENAPNSGLGSLTSPIRTSGAAATRTAETVLVNSFPTWFNATPNGPGTVYVEGEVDTPCPQQNRMLVAFESTTPRYIVETADLGVNLKSEIGADGFQGSHLANFVTITDPFKMAHAWQLNDSMMFANGSATAADLTLNIPALNALRIGCNQTGFQPNGYIRRVGYWPRRLSNTEIDFLTT